VVNPANLQAWLRCGSLIVSTFIVAALRLLTAFSNWNQSLITESDSSGLKIIDCPLIYCKKLKLEICSVAY
jgi:hypothetical protein